jgi:protein-disulfide isomerase
MNSSITIPLAIVMGGTILAVAVYVSIPKVPQKIAGDPALVRPVNANDHILGNPTAPIIIVEYSDFDCTFCKDFHNTLHQVIANLGADGDVAWVYRHFPLSQIHPNALSHARASECIAKVAGNDAFWKFTDALFASQPVNPSSYGELASSIGISGDGFASCYAKVPTEVDARIAGDTKNAQDVGAQGTPYSLVLVAGKAPVVMNGAYSYDAVRQILDQALIQ